MTPITMSKLIRVKAADYTTVDEDLDLLHRGCVNTKGRTTKFLYGHSRNIVLGNVVELSETDEGLFATIKLADEDKSPMMKQALYELEHKLVDKMSIGFNYTDYVYNKDEGRFDVTGLTLFEISMTAIPCNDNTGFLGYVEEPDENVDGLIQAIDGLVSSINSINN